MKYIKVNFSSLVVILMSAVGMLPGTVTSTVFAQIRVTGGTSTNTNTYNITNSGDDVTTNAVSGTLRITNRQFIDVSNETGFSSAVTIAAASGYNVRITNTQTVDASVSVPSNVFVEFVGTGKMHITNASDSVLFGGGVDGPPSPIFGTNNNRIKIKQNTRVRPEWWFIDEVAGTDVSLQIKYALESSIDTTSVTVEFSSAGYHKVNTTVLFPKGRRFKQVTLEGNGATLYSSVDDTLFLIHNENSSSLGPKHPRHTIRNFFFKRTTSSLDQGVAIVATNTVNARIENCQFEGWKNGVVLLNTSSGWTEGTKLLFLRFPDCDTSLAFKSILSGAGSFANTQIIGCEFAAGARATPRFKKVVHIYLNQNARVYGSNFEHAYFAISDSTKGLYSDGKLDGTRGYFRIEGFGTNGQDESYGMYFDTNSINVLVDWFIGVEGMNKMEEFIHNGSSYPISGIRCQLQAQGGTTNRGMSTIVTGDKFTYLESVITHDSLAYSIIGSGGVPKVGTYDYIFARGTDGKMRVRIRGSVPMEFNNQESGAITTYAPVRLLDVGSGVRNINDSTYVRADLLTDALIGSNDPNSPFSSLDTLKGFPAGFNGQEIILVFADDSVLVDNLATPTQSGRIFLIDNRDWIAPQGSRLVLRAETDATGIFWREIDRTVKIEEFTWNPASLAANATDSTDVTIPGVLVGDPIIVGFAGITSAPANWDLKGHCFTNGSVRVYITNRNGGTINLGSATGRLRYER